MTLLKDLRLIKRSFVQENQHFIVQQFQNNLQYGTIFWTKARDQAKNAKRGINKVISLKLVHELVQEYGSTKQSQHYL